MFKDSVFPENYFTGISVSILLSVFVGEFLCHCSIFTSMAFSLIKSFLKCIIHYNGFSGGSDSKESTCNARDPGSIPGLGRSSGEGSGNPLQYSYLENPMDRGAWQATVHGVTRVGHDLVTKPPSPLKY